MIKKNIKYYITLVFMLMILPNVVMALGETCNNLTYTVAKWQTTQVPLANGEVYNLNTYNTTAPGVSGLKTYCLSPGSKGPGSGSTYKCARVLDPTGATTGVGSKYHAYDVAITKAYQLLKGKSLGDIPDRQIGEIVFRWLSFNYNGVATEYANISSANRTIGYFKPVYGGHPNPLYWDIDNDVTNTAKEIYYEAKAIGDRIFFGKESYESIASEIDSPIYTTKVLENTTTASGRTLKVEIAISNPPEKIYWETLKARCSNGLTCKLVDNGSNGSSGRIVTILVSGSKSGGKIAVDFDIYDSNSVVSNIMLLKANNKQDMIVVLDEDNHGAWPGTVEVPIEDTPPISDFCRVEGNKFIGPNGTPVSEQTFYEQCCDLIDPNTPEYQKYCSCGEPDLDFIGACSEFNSDDDIVVNHVSDTKDNANLKTCLFRNYSADLGKNKYQMLDQTTIVNNPYCKVSCIEEYDFKLPNAKYTTSGGYFSLSSEVSGKRTCYVNSNTASNYNGINYTKFKSDLTAKSRQVVDAYNEYAKWKAAAETAYTYEEGSDSASGSSDSNNCGPNGTVGPCGDGCPGGATTRWKIVRKSWSYTAYNYSGGTYRLSDSYESGGKTSCGSCTCDSDNIGTEADHAGLRDAALTVLNTRIKELKNIIRTFNNCSGSINNGDSDMNSTGWENNFVFNPKIQFSYDEPYQDMNGFNNIFEKVSSSGSSSENYCTGDIGETYECSGSSSVPTKGETYITCTNTGCRSVTSQVGAARYITKEKSENGTYQPKNKFSVYTPIGTIKLNEDTGLYTVLCKEENCLPVSLNKTTGAFNFKFKFSNIGQYNDTNTNGRLMGGSNNVFDAADVDAGYVCQYINNCPECDYTCVGEHCEITQDTDCPDCPYICQNCIFDGKAATYYYRTVSVNNLFPNEREYGPNWNNEKGTYTKSMVEREGEEIYKEPEYSYTINANQMKRIREFNQSVGGYLNTQMPNGENALSCYSLNSNGVEYNNIYCISSFLNTPGNTYFTENKRNDMWTLWPDSGYFTSSTKYSVRDGVGPAWK